MHIASLRNRITFQKNETVVDHLGNHMNKWADFYSCATNAAATTYQQREQEQAGTIVGENGINFTVRYCSELSDLDSTHYRVMFRGRPYNITSVDMKEFDHKSIEIACSEELRDFNVNEQKSQHR